MKQRQVPDFSDGASRFTGTFEALRKVMTEIESHSNPSSRPGTSDSGDSSASKHENNTLVLCQNMSSDFLRASPKSLQYISWDPENLMFDARLSSSISRANSTVVQYQVNSNLDRKMLR